MKKQRILSLLLALAMVFSLLPASAMAVDVKTFSDVDADAWYYKYVDFVTDKEYFVGTSKTTFAPEVFMTRAMFVTVLAAVEGVKVNNNVSPFADVPANTWYSGAVAWAAEKGVVAGIGDNKFAPETEISREQMAVMMDAYVKWHTKTTGESHKEKSKVDGFKDADKISSWAKDSVEKCRNWGLIAGMPDGNFWPLNTASRAEVATVIYNLVWLIGGGGGGGGGTGGSSHDTHDYSVFVNWVTQPTCTANGVATYKCSGCSLTKDVEVENSALGHDLGEWVVTKEATADEAGEKRRDCSRCDYFETEVIDALGGGDEPIIPDPEQPIDYIYNAVSAVIADVKGDIEDKINHDIPANGSVDWKDSYLGYTGLTLGANGNKYAIDVTVEADLGTDSIKSIVKFAAVNAVKLAGGTVALVKDPAAVAEVKEQVEALVKKTIDILEDKMGIDITLSKQSIDEIVDYIVDNTKDVASDAVDYSENYVRSLRKHFVDQNGKKGYVTGDVTISMATGHTVELDVEKNSVSLGKISTDKDVIDIAAVYVRDMIAALKQVDTDALRSAVKNGVIKAVDFAKVKINNNADAAEFVSKTISKVENKLNITIPMDSKALADLAVDVYDYALEKAYAGYVYGEKIWDVLDANSDKITAVAYMAAGMAKDMYGDLKSYTTYTNLNKIELSTTVNVLFSDEYSEGNETEYAEDTKQFGHLYPVTFTLKMADTGSETTIGDNVQYMYNGIHNVKFIVTEKMQAAYSALANQVVATVVTPILNAALDKALEQFDFSAMVGGRAVAVMALSAEEEDTSFIKLPNIDFSDITPEYIDQLISNATNAWANDNLTNGDIANSPFADYVNNKDAAFDNSAIYEAVDAVLKEKLDPVIADLNKEYGESIVAGAAANDENWLVDEMTSLLKDTVGEKYDQLSDMGVIDYVIAATRDKMDPTGEYNDGKKYTESSVIYDYDTETDEYVPVTVTPSQNMQTGVDKVVVETIDNAFKPTDGSEPVVDVELVKKAVNLAGALTDAKKLASASTDDLAGALRNPTFQNFIQGKGDSITDKVCDLIEKLPAKASIVIGGVTINEKALDAVRNATTTADACLALANVLDEFKGMSLATFEETQVISVRYGSKSASFGLAIDLE